jgi:RNA polymerase sigma-70 factor, ECF subfamily
MLMSDGELVRQVLQGHSVAFAELVRRWSARVLAVCRSHIHIRDMAEELAQESLLRAYQALASLEDPEKFGAWVRGIAVRVCLDWRKSRQSSQVPFSTLGADGQNYDVPARQESAVEELERAEDVERLMHEVGELSPEYREVLLLYYYDNVTYQQLADMLGVSRATVNLRLTKARALLRERLSRTLR